jgi:hypothetical protein
MSAVSIAEAWPLPGKPFTVAELDRMPDDGHRYGLPGRRPALTVCLIRRPLPA